MSKKKEKFVSVTILRATFYQGEPVVPGQVLDNVKADEALSLIAANKAKRSDELTDDDHDAIQDAIDAQKEKDEDKKSMSRRYLAQPRGARRRSREEHDELRASKEEKAVAEADAKAAKIAADKEEAAAKAKAAKGKR